jgi:hypothetical protein
MTIELLKNAYAILRDIWKGQKEIRENLDKECPYCMGELLDVHEREFIAGLRDYIESYQPPTPAARTTKPPEESEVGRIVGILAQVTGNCPSALNLDESHCDDCDDCETCWKKALGIKEPEWGPIDESN